MSDLPTGSSAGPSADLVALALRERVKELTCLYGLSQLAADDELPAEELLRRAVRCLPPAWLHPDVAAARVTVDGCEYTTPRFAETRWRQSADVEADGVQCGTVEVGYFEERPAREEGPFLNEERALLDAVARKLGLILERSKAREDRTRLRDQLIHADRLATVGRLAAGLAHELNEPLGAVLGFGQLARKSPALPAEAATDLDRVLAAALHAREIVRKLMLFARRTPPRREPVDVRTAVEEALTVVSTRCTEHGVRVVREYGEGLRPILADLAQVRQVVVNLAVNAVQSMERGGRLTVRTAADGDCVLLSVADEGTGMAQDVLERIFMPFFTTKDVGEGTGLGLSVVHGIVASHGGSIRVTSEIGRGSRFDVRLPVVHAPSGGVGD